MIDMDQGGNFMDKKAMYKLTYGLFVLTSASEGTESGCIINTAGQVTSSPQPDQHYGEQGKFHP